MHTANEAIQLKRKWKFNDKALRFPCSSFHWTSSWQEQQHNALRLLLLLLLVLLFCAARAIFIYKWNGLARNVRRMRSARLNSSLCIIYMNVAKRDVIWAIVYNLIAIAELVTSWWSVCIYLYRRVPRQIRRKETFWKW